MWRARPADERLALAIGQAHDLSELAGRILAARGIDLDAVADFLNPTLRASLPDPSLLRDMDAAADRVAAAIMAGEQMAVFGDYDVDGATSSALLARFSAAVGGRLLIYIPDRLREGYGPNEAALRKLRAEGCSLVITVDCGISAFAPLKAAAEAGLDIVVCDHHEAEAQLPRAVAVVNPNRLDESGAYGQLAAVGVTFLLCVAVNRALRGAGWYRARTEPDLLQWLDLVALGTVADVVPLTGVNRAFVAQGLKVMAGRGNAGLAALADVAGLDRRPDTYHAGYVLGPRVNAGGRVGEAGLGAAILSTDDAAEAAAMAGRLDAYNRERREIERRVLDEAYVQAEERLQSGAKPKLIFAVGENWHPGVIGIVASRLKDRFNLPACVVALDGNMGKGSGRSVAGIDLGAAVLAARQAGLLINGGGHRMAAGLTVARERVAALGEFLAARVAAQMPPGGLVPSLGIDGAIAAGGATPELVESFARLAPFGTGNPEPRFVLVGARIAHARIVGTDHVRLDLTAGNNGRGNGGGNGNTRLTAVAFGQADRPLGRALLGAVGRSLYLAGHLRLDTWQGRSRVEMRIDDAADAPGDR